MTPLDALIARVGEAKGADREIEMRMHVLLGRDAGEQSAGTLQHWYKFGLFTVEKGEKTDPFHFCYGFCGHAQIPPYTASLDAAVKLVEEKLPGYRWNVQTYPSLQALLGDKDAQWLRPNAAIGKPLKDESFPFNYEKSGVASAATPALALLSALLSAIKQGETG